MEQIMDFTVMDYEKLFDMVQVLHCNSSFRNSHLFHNQLKAMKILYLFKLPICVSLEFHILQPEQHIALG